MTVLAINHGIGKSINILTMVIRLMIKCDVHTPWYYFRQEVQWTLAIRKQLSTLSVLDLDHIHHLPHTLR
jgi:hypothetical protein